jgi:hypothetical protein
LFRARTRAKRFYYVTNGLVIIFTRKSLNEYRWTSANLLLAIVFSFWNTIWRRGRMKHEFKMDLRNWLRMKLTEKIWNEFHSGFCAGWFALIANLLWLSTPWWNAWIDWELLHQFCFGISVHRNRYLNRFRFLKRTNDFCGHSLANIETNRWIESSLNFSKQRWDSQIASSQWAIAFRIFSS